MKKGQLIVLIGTGIAATMWGVGCGGSSGGGGGTITNPNATPSPIGTISPSASPTPGVSPIPSPSPLASPSPSPSPSPSAAVVKISVVSDPGNTLAMGFAFQDQPSVVHPGDSVEWVNPTAAPHGITWDSSTPSTSPGPGANIPVFQAGTTSQAWVAPNVTQITTYNYHCTIHGIYMNNVVTVTPNP